MATAKGPKANTPKTLLLFLPTPTRPRRYKASTVIPQKLKLEWPEGKDILASICALGGAVQRSVARSKPQSA